MRNRFIRFMYGRYGFDSLNGFIYAVTFVCLFLSSIFSMFRLYFLYSILRLFSVALIVIATFRMFSKNHPQRSSENRAFAQFSFSFLRKLNKKKDYFSQLRHYKIFKCSLCGKRVRIPRGHGRVEITCPHCRNTFIGRT